MARHQLKRLRQVQERARLEKAVEDKIAEERRTQLQRKRKEQEQRLQEQVLCRVAALRGCRYCNACLRCVQAGWEAARLSSHEFDIAPFHVMKFMSANVGWAAGCNCSTWLFTAVVHQTNQTWQPRHEPRDLDDRQMLQRSGQHARNLMKLHIV